jgi:hypothetical protein
MGRYTYLNDFVSGALGFDGAETLDRAIAEKIQKYRADSDAVVFTLDTHGEDYLKRLFPKLVETLYIM